MSDTQKTKSSNKAISYLIISVAVAVMALFFPRSQFKPVQTALNSTWELPDLKSDQDFTLSEDQSMTSEQIRSEHAAIYRLNSSLANSEAVKFEQALQNVALGSDSLINYTNLATKGRAFLLRVIGKGIIDELPEKFPITVIENQTSQFRSESDLFTIAEAIQEMNNEFSAPELKVVKSLFTASLKPSLVYDSQLNERAIADKLLLAQKMQSVAEGSVIIGEGELINAQKKKTLERYNQIHRASSFFQVTDWWRFIGYLLLTSLILSIFMVYLNNHDPEILQTPSRLIFLIRLGGGP